VPTWLWLDVLNNETYEYLAEPPVSHDVPSMIEPADGTKSCDDQPDELPCDWLKRSAALAFGAPTASRQVAAAAQARLPHINLTILAPSPFSAHKSLRDNETEHVVSVLGVLSPAPEIVPIPEHTVGRSERGRRAELPFAGRA
jgi:hypothetical protein